MLIASVLHLSRVHICPPSFVSLCPSLYPTASIAGQICHVVDSVLPLGYRGRSVAAWIKT